MKNLKHCLFVREMGTLDFWNAGTRAYLWYAFEEGEIMRGLELSVKFREGEVI